VVRALLLAAVAALAGGRAAAQACPDARFPARLICADDDLRAADAALDAAYRALHGRLDATTRERLQAAQERWLAERATVCDSHWAQGAARQAECLRAKTERRRAALATRQIEGEAIAGPPGAPRLVIDVRTLGDLADRCAVNVQLPRLLGMRAQEFNDVMRAHVTSHYFERAGRCGARPPAAAYYEHDIDFRITWNDARVLALTLEIYHDDGDGRPDLLQWPFAFDAATGRQIGRDDVLAPDMFDPLAALCLARIQDRSAIPVGEIDAMEFRWVLENEATWSYAPEAATVGFPASVRYAARAAGLSCTLRPEELQPYLRADNPLWPPP
jgi:uncharacterized protein YecT (DUF1311 family)